MNFNIYILLKTDVYIILSVSKQYIYIPKVQNHQFNVLHYVLNSENV